MENSSDPPSPRTFRTYEDVSRPRPAYIPTLHQLFSGQYPPEDHSIHQRDDDERSHIDADSDTQLSGKTETERQHTSSNDSYSASDVSDEKKFSHSEDETVHSQASMYEDTKDGVPLKSDVEARAVLEEKKPETPAKDPDLVSTLELAPKHTTYICRLTGTHPKTQRTRKTGQ
jgi:hypothetical protein